MPKRITPEQICNDMPTGAQSWRRVVEWDSRDVKNGVEVFFNFSRDLLKLIFNESKDKRLNNGLPRCCSLVHSYYYQHNSLLFCKVLL